MPTNDFQDIADDDGGVILLTRNAQACGILNCGDPANLCDGGPNPAIPCYGLYMVRFNICQPFKAYPADGGTVHLGFQVSHTGVNSMPVDSKLNDVACNDELSATQTTSPEEQ